MLLMDLHILHGTYGGNPDVEFEGYVWVLNGTNYGKGIESSRDMQDAEEYTCCLCC